MLLICWAEDCCKRQLIAYIHLLAGPPWRSRAKLAAALLAAGVGSVTVLHAPLEQVGPLGPDPYRALA